MHDLTISYDKVMYDYLFVRHYLDTLGYKLDSPTKNSLTTAKQRLASQINSVYLSPVYGVLNCYKGYVSENCTMIKSNVDAGVKKYALDNIAITLIDYLEQNSYSADLYYYTDNKLSKSGCTLSPISAPNRAKYALNCNGSWLNPAGDILIQNPLHNKLAISGLSYYGYDNNNQYFVKYSDSILNSDAFYPNHYEGDTSITVNHDTLGQDTKLRLIKLDQNHA